MPRRRLAACSAWVARTRNGAEIHLLAGVDLPDDTEPASAQQRAGAGGHEHLRAAVEPVERGKVEVVVMDVRDEDHVDSVERSRID